MKLCAIHAITASIRLQSGLHIGAGKDTVEIGGLDQPIIKDPLSGKPYIPGSSLKGKMRSLLETAVFMGRSEETRRAITTNGSPCDCGHRSCPVCTLFGAHKAPGKCDDDLGPTRMLVRDAPLSMECSDSFRKGKLPMEIKYENTIHRVRGVADHPRPLERVPAGVRFDLNIALKVYEGDDPSLMDWIFRALKLVELDALGGCSSRGCGQVVFRDIRVDGEVRYGDLSTFADFWRE